VESFKNALENQDL